MSGINSAEKIECNETSPTPRKVLDKSKALTSIESNKEVRNPKNQESIGTESNVLIEGIQQANRDKVDSSYYYVNVADENEKEENQLNSNRVLVEEVQEYFSNPDSLESLKELSKEKVIDFGEKIKELSDLQGKENHTIIVGFGGTVFMEKTPDGLKPNMMTKSVLKELPPAVSDKFYIQGFDAFRIDSSDVEFHRIHDLLIAMNYWHKCVKENNNIKDKFRGFLVTHGTDTMAESSTYTAMCAGQHLPYPIVFTGSQRSIYEGRNDARMNLEQSLLTAESMERNNYADVVIVFGEKVLLAVGAEKFTTRKDGFRTTMHPVLFDFTKLDDDENTDSIDFHSITRTRNGGVSMFRVFGGVSSALEIHASVGLSTKRLVRWAEDEEIKGIFIQPYKTGTINHRVLDAIKNITEERNIPAFCVTNKKLTTGSGQYEQVNTMLNYGINPLRMTMLAAKAKFERVEREVQRTYPESDCNKKQEIQVKMQEQLIGEIPPNNKYGDDN